MASTTPDPYEIATPDEIDRGAGESPPARERRAREVVPIVGGMQTDADTTGVGGPAMAPVPYRTPELHANGADEQERGNPGDARDQRRTTGGLGSIGGAEGLDDGGTHGGGTATAPKD